MFWNANGSLKVQAQLGQLRVEAHGIKSVLEATIGQHKEALKEAKTIEKTIQVSILDLGNDYLI